LSRAFIKIFLNYLKKSGDWGIGNRERGSVVSERSGFLYAELSNNNP
jgi:hypothetical protein